ncbi:MAG TPA: PHP domain-containing protein [Syntrophomonadaceae bacterium]|nr:PHP domain-containing protein [Syntrophomonadaceae bacterium]
MKYDLHVHTTASDGVLSPAEVIQKAYRAGLSGLAITDHDTVSGLREAEEFLQKEPLDFTFIPGIEMNTEWDENEIHILGYFINPLYRPLLDRLVEIRQLRYQRAQKIVHTLQEMNYKIEMEQVKNLAEGEMIGRPHIARALIENAYVRSIDEAFLKLLGRGKPAYVPRYKFQPAEAIHLIKEAGGVAVLAHPGLIRDPGKITETIHLGIEGIEVYYPQHSSEQIEYFLAMAQQENLLITGGSDFHGPGGEENRNHLGMASIDATNLRRLYNYCNAKKKE